MTRLGVCFMLGLSVALAMFAGSANADILYFSGEVSDNGEDPADYGARVEWDYSELDHVLAITVYNDTDDFTIANLRFNTSNDVWLMFLPWSSSNPLFNDDYPNASLDYFSGPTEGYGYFDWDLDFARHDNGLDPGESTTFYLYVLGDHPNDSDFFSHLSWNCDEGQLAALRFTNDWYDYYWRCYRNDSTWGIPGTPPPPPPPPLTVVPEPASMVLFGLGLVAVGLRRKLR